MAWVVVINTPNPSSIPEMSPFRHPKVWNKTKTLRSSRIPWNVGCLTTWSHFLLKVGVFRRTSIPRHRRNPAVEGDTIWRARRTRNILQNSEQRRGSKKRNWEEETRRGREKRKREEEARRGREKTLQSPFRKAVRSLSKNTSFTMLPGLLLMNGMERRG